MIINLIGFSGAFIFLTAYFLNSLQFLSSENLMYHFLNFFGSILLGFRVWLDKNYSNLMLEICFFGIASYYILKIIFFNFFN